LSSVAPRLPESGWKVLYKDALTAFLADERNLEHAGAVAEWIERCRADGPPAQGIDAGQDIMLSALAGTRIVAEYLVVDFEFLIIVKEFR
jgi:hypothetical protein